MNIIDNRFLVISNGLYINNDNAEFHNKILIYDLQNSNLLDSYNLGKDSFKNIINPEINIFNIQDKKYINIFSGYQFINDEYNRFNKFINIEFEILMNGMDRIFSWTK
jgi:hypothetical protein